MKQLTNSHSDRNHADAADRVEEDHFWPPQRPIFRIRPAAGRGGIGEPFGRPGPFWRSPGGRYPVGPGAGLVEVGSIELVPFADITDADVCAVWGPAVLRPARRHRYGMSPALLRPGAWLFAWFTIPGTHLRPLPQPRHGDLSGQHAVQLRTELHASELRLDSTMPGLHGPLLRVRGEPA